MASEIVRPWAGFVLPQRDGERPMTQRVIPHSQLTQIAPEPLFNEFRDRLFKAFPATNVEQKPSCISVETAEALCLKEGIDANPAAFMKVAGSREFAHLHPHHDTSMHVNLPIEVEEEVLKKGWGERHPKWDVGVKETLLFAPRNPHEIELILKIVTISYWYASNAHKVVIPNNPLEGRVFDEKEQEAVVEVIKSGLMSRYTNWEGKVSQFEKKVSKHLGVNHSLMVSTGSAAMIAGLMGLGIGPGDEVIVSAYTWISTAASVIAVGAVPVIAEIDDSLGIDPVAVESKITPHTKCLFLTHMAGVPNRIDALLAVAKKHNLFLVEDCCQCVGGKYKGKYVGTQGDAGFWSMNHFKNICVGEAGLIYTNSRRVFEGAWSATEPGFQEPHTLPSMQRFPETKEFFQAWETDHFVHTTARASEMMGAVGLVQLDKMDPQLDTTRALKKRFLSKLVASPFFSLQHVDDPEGDCGISVTLILADANHVSRFLSLLSSSQIMARPIFTPKVRDSSVYYWWDSILQKKSHHPTGYPWKDPAYKGSVQYSKEMCAKSLDILGRAIMLSFSIKMTTDHVDYMVDAVNKAVQTLTQ